MPRRRYWAAVAIALLVTGAGVALAVSGSGSSATGPAAAVLRYFADLEHGDAAAARTAGRLPPGRRTFLTDRVLAEQQRIAPIRGVAVDGVTQHGRRAVVRVDYRLGPRPVHAAIRTRERGGRWRLDRAAVAVVLDIHPAADRATLAGHALPNGPVLLFPGAVPIEFDTPYLAIAAGASVGFESPSALTLRVRLTHRGRSAAVEALGRALHRCLTTPRPDCPQPRGRVVPGTVRGGLAVPAGGHVRVTLGPQRAGVLDLHCRVRMPLRFERLDFRNRPHAVSGTFALRLHARAYAVAPLHIVWQP